MQWWKLIEITRYAVKETDRGFVFTLGFVRDGVDLHFIVQASRWDDELIKQIQGAHSTEKDERLRLSDFRR